MSGRAFMLRMNPGGHSRVPTGLSTGQVGIGWGAVGPELMNSSLDRTSFAAHVHRTYYPASPNRIRSGITAGQLWRFLRVMAQGDLVAVPDGRQIHLAEVMGLPTFEPRDEDWAFRRQVEWLTGQSGLSRAALADRLRRAFHDQRTCSDISDFLTDLRVLAA